MAGHQLRVFAHFQAASSRSQVVAKANLSLRNRESRTPLEALKPGSLTSNLNFQPL